MMKLRATNPLVLFVGALAIGLAGCADDVIITEPPPPPPPPPPEAAEISIVSFVDADDGTELGESDLGSISGEFGVVINFDTGGFEAAALDLFVDSNEVACQTFSGQAAVGLAGDVQTVQCIIDSAEGVGACTGTTMMGRFDNGPHTIAAELTLQDGSTVRATRANPVVFANSNGVIVVPNEIGPRVVGLDEEGWWGGPRDLSWYACPIVFDSSLDDFGGVCEVTIGNNGGMLLTSTSTSVTDDEEPYEAIALYRDVPTSDATWIDEDSRNEDEVEDTDITVWVTKVLACDGTNITSDFPGLFGDGDTRNIDLSAPLCDDDPCEVWIDDEYPINDGNAAGFTNNLFSGGDFELRDDEGDIIEDGGVGLVLGTTTVLAAWDYADGDLDNIELFLTPVFGVDDLTEDDACGDDGTTDQALGANTFATAYGQCAATGEEGAPVDAYVIQIARVGDLLLNELGDGTADIQIEDEFITELDAPSGVVISGQLGADFTGPEIDPDELMPPADDPLFVWNPDLNFDGIDPDTRGCDPASALPGNPLDETLCENVMFEALDPDLASGDPGAGVEDTGCGPATNPATTTCADGNGDGEMVHVEIDDGPGTGFDDNLVQTAQAFGTAPTDGMFAGYICDVFDALLGYPCDGNNDGTYTLTHTVPDKAQVENNVSTASYSFVIDTNQPIIGFGGITGLNSSNAATVEFVLSASVVDRNGDGTAVASAEVQVTAFSAGPGDCSLGGEDLVDEDDVLVTPEGGNDDATGATVIVDVTSEVQANGGDFDVLFTAENLGPGLVTYCFTIIADDGAERKDGTDDGLEINAVAGKDFTWQ